MAAAIVSSERKKERQSEWPSIGARQTPGRFRDIKGKDGWPIR